MAHWFKTLFAATGTKTAVPDAADPSGFISYDTGYGPDYQRVLGTDPLAKTIERDKLNQVLYDITGAVQQYQTHGFPEYIDATANGGVAYAYAIDAIVLFTDGKNYVNTVAANTNAPNVSGWIELGSVSTLVHNMASDADYTLGATENKYLRINITDTSVFLTTGRNIIVDNSQRRILVVNNTLQILTFKTSAGTGIAVAAGTSSDLLCDGVNIIDLGAASWVANDPRAKTALNATGVAPIYALRVWVSFNATGVIAIRASGNVSSITDTNIGRFVINMATAMPDTNFTMTSQIANPSADAADTKEDIAIARTTSSVSLVTTSGGTYYDSTYTSVQITR